MLISPMIKLASYLFILSSVGCASVSSNLQKSNIPQLIKNICLNFEGKTQIEMGRQKIVGSIESVVKNSSWLMGLSVPLLGQEVLKASWIDNEVILSGSVQDRLQAAFNIYLSQNGLKEDPSLIIDFVKSLTLMIKHIHEFDEAKCQSENSGHSCGDFQWSIGNQLELKHPVNERFDIKMSFSSLDQKFKRVGINLVESKRPHLVQDILIRQCQ